MEVVVERSASTGREQQVVVPSRVIAALAQLEPAEQTAVRAAFRAIGRDGVQSGGGVVARRLATPDPNYVLYLAEAPDVLVIVRATPDAPIEIVDLVRPETLEALFHAQ